MKILLYLLPVLLAVFLTSGCQTDYTEEALQRAREYTLDNTRILPEVARNHIRFVAPRLQTAVIFPHRPMTLTEYSHISRNVDYNPISDSKLDTIVAQFVWTPPKLGYSVIVIGHSRKDLSYWSPMKVVLKHVVRSRWFYEIARRKAIRYITDNMLYLTRLERVRVRTSEAEIRETQFDLEYMFEEQFESAQNEWKTFLEELKKQRNRKQYSVVWEADDPQKRIVVTGFGSELDLKGWKPSCGMVITLKQLDEYTAEIAEKLPDAPDEPQKPSESDYSDESDDLDESEDSEESENTKELSNRSEMVNHAESAAPKEGLNRSEMVKPAELGNPAATAAPSETAKPAEPAAPKEGLNRSETANPAEPAAPKEGLNRSEMVKPAEPAAPKETAKPVESGRR